MPQVEKQTQVTGLIRNLMIDNWKLTREPAESVAAFTVIFKSPICRSLPLPLLYPQGRLNNWRLRSHLRGHGNASEQDGGGEQVVLQREFLQILDKAWSLRYCVKAAGRQTFEVAVPVCAGMSWSDGVSPRRLKWPDLLNRSLWKVGGK
jgi:hypothetical protein